MCVSKYKSKIIENYKRYGFEYRKSYSNDSYITFTYRTGFFHNAEIIEIGSSKEDKENIEKRKKELVSENFSVSEKKFKGLKEIEDELFDGFFEVDKWKDRIRREYDEYVESVLLSYPAESHSLDYNYVNSSFAIVNKKNKKDIDIVSSIKSNLSNDSAQLILIEAPAGFGKTSTSYELIKKMVESESRQIPFFTEFSRDRQAKIFNHVFLKEVDRVFNQISSSLVIEELKNGRLIMVLDGFDELLADTDDVDSDDVYENAEPMLETISELLEGKAKIVITSRRSAMFDGATFAEWIDRYEDKFEFIRYRIETPKVENWLPKERRDLLINAGLELDKISNPVILSYLKFSNDDLFNELYRKPSEILNKYFYSMLEREQDRQNLLMEPSKQEKLLIELAADMCSENYTSISKDKLIDFFKNRCSELIEDTRRLYKPSERPTFDALSNTLSNHAFFDRSSQGENRIEFVNEFVFGNYIAKDILRTSAGEEWLANDERFVEPAVASYAARTEEERLSLWSGLSSMMEFLSASDKLKFELVMLNTIVSENYSSSSFMSLSIEGVNLFDGSQVEEISFSNCTFKNVVFYIDNIRKATFISCKFYDCSFVATEEVVDEISFYNCEDNNTFQDEIETISIENNKVISVDISNELRKIILSRFLRQSTQTIDRRHIPLASIFKEIARNGYNKRDAVAEIKNLRSESILLDAVDGEYVELNQKEIQYVLGFLG